MISLRIELLYIVLSLFFLIVNSQYTNKPFKDHCKGSINIISMVYKISGIESDATSRRKRNMSPIGKDKSPNTIAAPFDPSSEELDIGTMIIHHKAISTTPTIDPTTISFLADIFS